MRLPDMQPMLGSSTPWGEMVMRSFPAACGNTATPSSSAALDGERPPVGWHLSSAQTGSLFRQLLVNKAAYRAEVERHATAIAAFSLGSPAGIANLDRATSALRMYVAWEAVEAINEALARIESGDYGTCGSCERPIAFERLEVTPQMRFCAACEESESRPTKSRPSGLRRMTNGDRL
jgi:RNA polymerase-binding transcription factor DksA